MVRCSRPRLCHTSSCWRQDGGHPRARCDDCHPLRVRYDWFACNAPAADQLFPPVRAGAPYRLLQRTDEAAARRPYEVSRRQPMLRSVRQSPWGPPGKQFHTAYPLVRRQCAYWAGYSVAGTRLERASRGHCAERRLVCRFASGGQDRLEGGQPIGLVKKTWLGSAVGGSRKGSSST